MHLYLFTPPAVDTAAQAFKHATNLKPNGQAKKKPHAKPATTATRAKTTGKKADKSFERYSKWMQCQTPPASDDETAFRHGHWTAKRALVRTALVSVNTSTRTLDNFDCCGSECTVEWSDKLQRYRTRANHCKSRHCEPCQKARANRLASNLKRRLEEKTPHRYRFITLTKQHSTAPLAKQIKTLYAEFRKLRASKLWKTSQVGGCNILEVKWNAKTNRWHPHLHVISEGGWMQQQALANEWKKVTGNSHVVDIRCLKDSAEAAHYLTKYVVKGTSDEVWKDASAAQEWIAAIKGVRVCSTYGKWRGFKLMEMPDSSDDWKPIATLNHIIAEARKGESWAMGVLLALRPPGSKTEVGKAPGVYEAPK